MAKQGTLTKRELEERWERLPKADRRFFLALSTINQLAGDDKLRYHELPPKLRLSLKRSTRNRLYSITAECLSILTKSAAMERVRAVHRKR